MRVQHHEQERSDRGKELEPINTRTAHLSLSRSGR